jgi:membrane fusion protein (multidrug efflux system)
MLLREPLLLPALVLLAAAVALITAGCRPAAAPAPPPPIVQVLTVAATNVPLTAEFIGQLDSPQNVEVRARVEAFVDQVLFPEGTEVKEGDPLFKLDDKPYKERLAAAKGVLAQAQASLKKYETDVARLRPLAEKKAVPQQDLDNALASVEVGKADVVSAQAQVESAQLDVGYCDVRAPITGLIGAKQVSVGSLVGKGEPTLLATISTMQPIWFYCAISEVEYLRAERRVAESGRRLGEVPLKLFKADGSEHPSAGKWVFLDRAVDPTTGTLRARAEFSNVRTADNWVLRPGMFARTRIELKTEKDSLVVPQRAVQELQGKNFVWVVGEGDKAAQRPVKLGAEIGGDVIVLEGLKAGERLIVEGVQKGRDGAPVQPRTAAQIAEAAAAAAQEAEAKLAAARKAHAGETKSGKE